MKENNLYACTGHFVISRGGPKQMTGGYNTAFNSGDGLGKSQIMLSYLYYFKRILISCKHMKTDSQCSSSFRYQLQQLLSRGLDHAHSCGITCFVVCRPQKSKSRVTLIYSDCKNTDTNYFGWLVMFAIDLWQSA